jgi:arylsulfatase A-like enzyme
VYEELMRVPFLVAHADGRGAGARLGDTVVLADVFPTALELALGRPPAYAVSGRSLVACLDRASEPEPRSVFLERPHYTPGVLRRRGGDESPERYAWGVLTAVVDDGFKLIRLPDGRTELYYLRTDPDESRDLSASHPGELARLAARLDAWLAAHPTAEPGDKSQVPAEQLEVLRALGYIGDDADSSGGGSER